MKYFYFSLMFILLNTVVFSQNHQKTMKELLSEYQFSTHTTTLDTLEIAYVKEGSGTQTLLFVHGLSSNADAWSHNIEVLKDNYLCVALDLPGYGKSSKPDADYTASYFAEVVYQFIEQLELKNVVLVGHSMGGQASIKLATTHPDVIEKLILVAPAGLERFSEAGAALMKSLFTVASVKNTTDEQISKNYALNFHEQPAEVSKMIADRKRIKDASDFDAHCGAIVKSVSGMLDDTVYQDLEHIMQPTLVVFGKQDQLIPNRYFNPGLTTEEVGKVALDKIKTASLEFIDEAGHFVQFEKPNKVNRLIRQFVEGQ